jgi:hypothetical protein
LAQLYQVPTKALNQAVRRNPDRFPEDFMFQLTTEEAESLRSQIVTSNEGRGGWRYLPYDLSEHGVAMLSSVLNSSRAVRMNILIIRSSGSANCWPPTKIWPSASENWKPPEASSLSDRTDRRRRLRLN